MTQDCERARAWGSRRLGAPRVPKPLQAAPFKRPEPAPLHPAPEPPCPHVQGSEWLGALLAQHVGTSRNRYSVKLGPILSLARAFRAGALGFLQPDAQKHVSSQPRRFFQSVENAPDTLSENGSPLKAAPRPQPTNGASRGAEQVWGRGCISIPGSGAFSASPATMFGEANFSLSGVRGGI